MVIRGFVLALLALLELSCTRAVAPVPRPAGRRRRGTCYCSAMTASGALGLSTGHPRRLPLDRLCRPSRRDPPQSAHGPEELTALHRGCDDAARRSISTTSPGGREAEAGGASMVRLCDGQPCRAARGQTYLLRTMGILPTRSGTHGPRGPAFIVTVLTGSARRTRTGGTARASSPTSSPTAPAGWRTIA